MHFLRTLCAISVLAAAPFANAGDDASPAVEPGLTLTNPEVVDQDDMCIWVHPADASLSTVIASDKSAGKLFVYDLAGNVLQTITDVAKPGNIDLRNGFPLGDAEVALVGLNERDGRRVHLYVVDPETRQLARADNGTIETGVNYGFTFYRSAKTGTFHAITVPDDAGGDVEQYALSVGGDGKIAGEKVRHWPIGQSEGCAADDETGALYIGEEAVGIWRIGAEPEDPAPGVLVAKVGEHGLTADVEGLTLLHGKGANRYLIASSQGNNRYIVYRTGAALEFVKAFTVAGATDTDGIDVSPANFGGAFPGGIFTLHNGAKAPYPVLVCDLRDLGLPLE